MRCVSRSKTGPRVTNMPEDTTCLLLHIKHQHTFQYTQLFSEMRPTGNWDNWIIWSASVNAQPGLATAADECGPGCKYVKGIFDFQPLPLHRSQLITTFRDGWTFLHYFSFSSHRLSPLSRCCMAAACQTLTAALPDAGWVWKRRFEQQVDTWWYIMFFAQVKVADISENLFWRGQCTSLPDAEAFTNHPSQVGLCDGTQLPDITAQMDWCHWAVTGLRRARLIRSWWQDKRGAVNAVFAQVTAPPALCSQGGHYPSHSRTHIHRDEADGHQQAGEALVIPGIQLDGETEQSWTLLQYWEYIWGKQDTANGHSQLWPHCAGTANIARI